MAGCHCFQELGDSMTEIEIGGEEQSIEGGESYFLFKEQREMFFPPF